jgi:hypothetical protein
MNIITLFKWLTIYIVMTMIFTVVLSFSVWNGKDNEYKYYTAIRMHALDIYKNNTSKLQDFNPEKCTVLRKKQFVGYLIDVECIASNVENQLISYTHYYSAISQYYDVDYEKSKNINNKIMEVFKK